MRGRFHIQMRLFSRPHATEKVADMQLHHVRSIHRNLNLILAEFVTWKSMAVRRLRTYNQVLRVPLELSILHHDERALVAANQSWNVL